MKLSEINKICMFESMLLFYQGCTTSRQKESDIILTAEAFLKKQSSSFYERNDWDVSESALMKAKCAVVAAFRVFF